MIPIRLVSELKGKFPKMSYSSISPAGFSILIYYSSLSNNFIPRDSANLTKATSSGEEA